QQCLRCQMTRPLKGIKEYEFPNESSGDVRDQHPLLAPGTLVEEWSTDRSQQRSRTRVHPLAELWVHPYLADGMLDYRNAQSRPESGAARPTAAVCRSSARLQ